MAVAVELAGMQQGLGALDLGHGDQVVLDLLNGDVVPAQILFRQVQIGHAAPLFHDGIAGLGIPDQPSGGRIPLKHRGQIPLQFPALLAEQPVQVVTLHQLHRHQIFAGGDQIISQFHAGHRGGHAVQVVIVIALDLVDLLALPGVVGLFFEVELRHVLLQLPLPGADHSGTDFCGRLVEQFRLMLHPGFGVMAHDLDDHIPALFLAVFLVFDGAQKDFAHGCGSQGAVHFDGGDLSLGVGYDLVQVGLDNFPGDGGEVGFHVVQIYAFTNSRQCYSQREIYDQDLQDADQAC